VKWAFAAISLRFIDRAFLRIIPVSNSLIWVLLVGVLACDETKADLEVYFVRADGTKTEEVEVEIVATRTSRQYGLMHRRTLGRSAGMLFLFPDAKPRSFWMKDTYLELDIIYVGEDRKVVSIIARAKPGSIRRLPSGGPAKYVLEVLGGRAEELGIAVGGTIVFDGELPPAK